MEKLTSRTRQRSWAWTQAASVTYSRRRPDQPSRAASFGQVRGFHEPGGVVVGHVEGLLLALLLVARRRRPGLALAAGLDYRAATGPYPVGLAGYDLLPCPLQRVAVESYQGFRVGVQGAGLGVGIVAQVQRGQIDFLHRLEDEVADGVGHCFMPPRTLSGPVLARAFSSGSKSRGARMSMSPRISCRKPKITLWQWKRIEPSER